MLRDARAARLLAWAFPLAFLLVHLASLAPTLEDIDSLNFALGLRHFDPARHQPHPPGNPVFMALGRLSLPLVHLLRPGMARMVAEAHALAFWSAVAGAVAMAASLRLFTVVEVTPVRGRAWWATLLLTANPLFWVTAQRPMSDMPGLAAALAAQALLLGGALVPGALLAGLAPGIRSQAMWLTVPVLVLVVLTRPRATRWRDAGVATMAFGAGALLWFVPLVVASGGPSAYLAALGSQAGEDFAGVDMLYNHPSARRLALGLLHSLVLPWGAWPLATGVIVLAAVGVVALWRHDRRALLVAGAAFGPYAVFHLVFQETVTTRYALPLMPLMAVLAVRGASWLGGVVPRAGTVVPAVLVAASFWVAIPDGWLYARDPHPAARALSDMAARAAVAPPAFLTAHLSLVRSVETAALTTMPVRVPAGIDPMRHLVKYWAGGGEGEVWFLADPRRTDLARLDPVSRRTMTPYRWAVADRAALGGVRPAAADWYRLSPPGWMVDEGWSLTPETGGVTAAANAGPHRQPIVAWVRRGLGARRLMVGARHLGEATDGDAELELSLDGQVLNHWRLSHAARNVLRFLDVPGVPDGQGPYGQLTLTARPTAGGPAFPVAIRQFDLQPASSLVWGFGDGWHEAESEFAVGRHWRWTSAGARLEVRGVTGPVRVTLRAESPARYFTTPVTVSVVAGGRVLATLQPADDFTLTAIVPAEALAVDGSVTITSSQVFSPPGDPRQLGLRVLDCRVEAVVPDVTR